MTSVDQDFADEVWAWQMHNFPAVTGNPHWPLMGMAEEAGELIHVLLKVEQGIRYSAAQAEEKQKDALADIGIFALSACTVLKWRVDYIFNRDCGRPLEPRNEAFAIFGAAGSMLDDMAFANARPETLSPKARAVIRYSRRYAVSMGWDFDALMRTTWQTVVSKRDWASNPQGG